MPGTAGLRLAHNQARIDIANHCHRLHESIRAVDVVADGIRANDTEPDPVGIYFLLSILTERMQGQVEAIQAVLNPTSD